VSALLWIADQVVDGVRNGAGQKVVARTGVGGGAAIWIELELSGRCINVIDD